MPAGTQHQARCEYSAEKIKCPVNRHCEKMRMPINAVYPWDRKAFQSPTCFENINIEYSWGWQEDKRIRKRLEIDWYKS